MTWNYAYTPQIWPPVLMVVLMIALAFYSGRRRSIPGATPLMFAAVSAAAWAACTFLETAAVDLATKIAWYKVQAVIQAPIIICITCFILEYTWPGRWLTRRNLALLFFPFLLSIWIVLTNESYHFAWRGFVFQGTIQPQWGPGGQFMALYNFGILGALNLIVFGWLFWRSPQHRWPVALMLVGQFAGRALYLLDKVAQLQFVLPFDMLGMSFEFLMYAIALFDFRIFDPISLARQTVIAQMREGILVLDSQERVASLNPAAAAILGSSARQVVGRPIQDLLPAHAAEISALLAAGAGQTEINLPGGGGAGTGLGTRDYQLETSSLKDWRGLEAGRLLLLQDVTEQKLARAQLLEHQRAQAMLHERERLARELHDDLGQVLAFISTQGQVIQQLLSGGDVTRAGSYVARLVEVADEANTDIRESILNLRAPFSGQGLIPTLQEYLRRYEGRYGLHTQLTLPENGLESDFEPENEVQILRILQEGLTNARKHASAHCLQITFTSREDRILIAMQDDGKGFEPDKLKENRRSGFGLQFMRERAEAIGGTLEMRSAPGEGTCVLLEVPVKECHA